MSHPFPSSSLQPANPSSALSRLVPVASPASAGSQQAINMLKEQNRLLTKVSGGTGGGHPLGGEAGRGRGVGWGWGRNMRQWKVFLQLGQPWSSQRRACGLDLETPCHAAVSSCLLGERP